MARLAILGRSPIASLLIEVSPPHGDVTLSGSSYGLHLALKEICRIYSSDKSQHPDCFPVVQLTTRTRQHKSYGAIKGPWFEVVGWASVEDTAGRKSQAALAKQEKGEDKAGRCRDQ